MFNICLATTHIGMDKQATELRYAVRFRVVFKYFGQLSLVLAALTTVPLSVSLYFGEQAVSAAYAVVIGGLVILGAGLAGLRRPAGIQANEGMVLVALMFVFSPLVMTYPLMLSSGLGFLDAFFEAVSGITTTGLSTKATLAGASATFLFARAWMQWYGALGIVVLSLALVMRPGLVSKGLAVSQTWEDDLIGGTRAHARRIVEVYGLMTVIGVIGAMLAGIRSFEALLYTMAGVSTGGFAPYDSSLAALDWPGQIWVILLCLAGAMPLSLYYRAVRPNRQLLAVDLIQVRAIVVAAVIVTLLLGTGLWLEGRPWAEIRQHAPLLAFSAQTTAGFSSLPPGQLKAGSKLVLIFAMLAGGGIGSTAGGFKLLRLLIAGSVLRLILVRTCVPRHAIVEPRLAGRPLREEDIQEALLLILVFVSVVTVSWLFFVMMGYAPLDSLFEVVSATGTVGLSVGMTSSTLPPLLKGVLCADMLMGRLEIIAWLVLLYPGTWFGRRMEVV